jgi:hypothetical protein
MAAKDYLVHRHFDAELAEDELDVWRPLIPGDPPSIQIDQSDGVTASITYRAEDAVALARAILEAAGMDPLTAFGSAH